MIILLSGVLVGKRSDFVIDKFEDFIQKYNKTYKNDPIQYFARLNIFQVIII